MSDKKQPAASPLPRSVEVLLAESRKLREAADRLEEQAKALQRAIHEEKSKRR